MSDYNIFNKINNIKSTTNDYLVKDKTVGQANDLGLNQGYVQPLLNVPYNNSLIYKVKSYADALGISMSSVNLFNQYKQTDQIRKRKQDITNSEVGDAEFTDYRRGSEFGQNIMDRWVELSQIDNPKNSILLEIVFININKPSKLIMNDIIGLEGSTLKQRVTSGDYNVSIMGSFFTRNSFTRPYEQLDTLLSIINNKDNPGIFNINSPYFRHVCNHTGNDRGYDTLVLTDMVFNEPTDFKNSLTFSLSCVTDLNIPVVTLSEEDQ